MTTKNFIVLSTTMLFLCCVSFAQEALLPQIIPPSPEAASLGKYGEIPVSHYTGIPNIQIPIYHIQNGTLSIPVYLSYHAGGHKVEDIASSVGLGWSLNAGGTITRTVRGLADELTGIGYIDCLPKDLDAYTEQQLQLAATDKIDTQPDIFFFNFGEYSGKFFFDKEGNCHVVPYQNFKIKPAIGPKKGANDNWEITTESGITFKFSAKELTTINSYCSSTGGITNTTPSPATYVSSWYLTEVTSPGNRHNIQFEYVNEDISHDVNISASKYWAIGASSSYNSLCETKLSTKSKKIRKITFLNGSLEVNPTSSGQNLLSYLRQDLSGSTFIKEIEIKNNEGSLVKKFIMDYSYFLSNCSTERCKRLKLEAITEYGPTLVSKPYLFEYNSQQLPSRDSFDKDHWGYFNNKGNTTLNPEYMDYNASQNTMVIFPGADKSPDPEASQACMLKRIYYPTGGSTKFEYQLNEVISDQLPNKTLGVKKVYKIEGNGSSPNKSLSFNVHGYYRPGQVVEVRYKITGCQPSGSDPDTNTHGFVVAPEFPSNCPYIEILHSNGTTYKALAYYPSENEQVFKSYIPNGNYTLKGSNAKTGQTYSVELKIDSEIDSPNKYAGGLRIAKVTNFDAFNPEKAIVEAYEYNDEDNLTTGNLSDIPLYHYLWGIEIDDNCNPNGTYLVLTVGSNTTLGTDKGSYVGYGIVTELRGNFGENGKSELYFTSIYQNNFEFNDGYKDIFPFGPPIYNNDWKRGFLKRQVDYMFVKSDPNKFKPVFEKINEYEIVGVEKIIKGLKVGIALKSCNNNPPGKTETSSFFNRVGQGYLLKSSREIIYNHFDNNTFVNYKEYNYNPVNLSMKEEKVEVNSIEKILTRYFYSSDFNFNGVGSNTMAKGIAAMLNNLHIQNNLIEKQIWKEKDNQHFLISSQLNLFKENGIDIDKILAIETKEPIIASGYNNPSIDQNEDFIFDSPKFQTKVVFNSYDNKGNLLELTKSDGVKLSYIWGYDNSLPIAQVINSRSQNAAYTGFELNSMGNWQYSGLGTEGNALTGKRYYSGNISTNEEIDAGEYTISFWAKGNGNITVANKTFNISGDWKPYQENIIHNTSGKISFQTGSILIDELSLIPGDAMISTYTSQPLLGMTANIDNNLMPTLYNYDGLNRLHSVNIFEKNQPNFEKNIVKKIDYNITGRNPNSPSDENNLLASFTMTGEKKTMKTIGFSAHDNTAGLVYDWDFGDGNIVQNGGKVISHHYIEPGWYIIKLLVKNGNNFKAASNLLYIEDSEVIPGPMPRISEINVTSAQSISSGDLSFPRRIIIEATTTAVDGTTPYKEYTWSIYKHVSSGSSNNVPLQTLKTTTPDVKFDFLTTYWGSNESKKYDIQCKVKDNNNVESALLTHTIDAPLP